MELANILGDVNSMRLYHFSPRNKHYFTEEDACLRRRKKANEENSESTYVGK
jgi:hypothetical protein